MFYFLQQLAIRAGELIKKHSTLAFNTALLISVGLIVVEYIY